MLGPTLAEEHTHLDWGKSTLRAAKRTYSQAGGKNDLSLGEVLEKLKVLRPASLNQYLFWTCLTITNSTLTRKVLLF